MAEWMSLAEAIAAHVRDGDYRGHGGIHPPDPVCGRARNHSPAPPQLVADPHDSGPDLRPADRRRMRREAHVFLGRKSRRGLAAPLSRCGRERLAGAARRSKSAATAIWPMPMWPARPICPSPCCADTRARTSRASTTAFAASPARSPAKCWRPRLPSGRMSRSFTRRRPTGKATCCLWGILGVQKEAVLAARRSIVTVEERVRSLDAPPNACILPALGGDRGMRSAARRDAVLCARLLRARQRLLPGLGSNLARSRTLQRMGRRHILQHARFCRVSATCKRATSRRRYYP